jgi:hypothetical protein
MKRPSTQKTPHYASAVDRRDGLRRGSISVLAVTLYLLFSVIGLGLIAVSQIYVKFSSYKKDLMLLDFAAESGIKQGFEAVAGDPDGTTAPAALSDAELSALKADAEAGGSHLLTRLMGRAFPISGEGGGSDETWEFNASLSGCSVDAGDGFFFSEYAGRLSSSGALVRRLPRKKESLDFTLRAAAGRFPLALFPFLVAGKIKQGKEELIRNDPNLVIAGTPGSDLRPGPAITEAPMLPTDMDPLLKKALQVKIFSPDKLSRAEVRAALGLEMVDEPVPEGVYLVRNTNGLGGVYVQGDAARIILAIENGWQFVLVEQGGSAWTLKFNPSLGRTIFLSPTETAAFDRLPLGIIMVAGKVDSLGGGTVDGAGLPVLQTGDPLPCILGGVSLTIVSTGRLEISSHLVQEGVRWADGLPYLKDSTSQLVVWSGGDLALNPASREIHVQASLTAGGTMSVTGRGKSAIVAGGTQMADIELGGNRMTIVRDERSLEPKRIPVDAPRAAAPLLMIVALRPLRWNE